MKKFCVSVFAIFIFLFLAFAPPARAFDAAWMERYEEQKLSLLTLISELEQLLGEDRLFFSGASVRKLLDSGADVNRQTADDYIKVLETGTGYVSGYDFPDSENDPDIKNVHELLAAKPPYTIDFYDDAKYKLKKINDYVSLTVSYLPRYIQTMRADILIVNEMETNRQLRLSAFFLYVKKHIAKIEELLPLISEMEKNLTEKGYSFTKDDLDKIEVNTKKRIEELNALGQQRLSVANYARQVEVDYLDYEPGLMKQRYELHSGTMKRDDIWKLKDELDGLLVYIYLEEDYINELQGELLRNGMQDNDEKEALQKLTYLVSDFFPRFAFIAAQMQDEVSGKIDIVAVIRKIAQSGKDIVYSLLGSEIWEGDGYRITLRKLVFMLIIFLISIPVCRWLSMLLARLVGSRLSKDAESLLQKVIFYSALLVSVLLAFNFAEIPLTSFAFVGGALAIGIGFGTQNTFNNIISGFILTTARPFKAGDRIMFGDKMHVVLKVGERSTHIRSNDDQDVFVPNRIFLEDAITNLTHLENSKFRFQVDVGVKYGTDHAQVKHCLLGIADGHKEVLKNPPPFVIINGFGASSINFSLFCWIDLRKNPRWEAVASEIYSEILDKFAETGITIPYQRIDISNIN